ncbi:MAG TPA: RyR domain-containing protein, partial [Gemmatimonadales bacterium]|nr:RyR domain-containing protein [Gemmatimonadales bacterium]
LSGLPNVVVRFGVEGAIHYAGGEQPTARLFYEPALSEDGFRERCRGGMIGLTDAFIAALVARVVQEGPGGVREGIRDGIRSSRRFFRAGFGADSGKLDYPDASVFGPPRPDDDAIADAVIPASPTTDSADPDFWCLLNELEGVRLEPLAHRLVLTGERSTLGNVPVGEFGGLRTVDRAEIESFRSIQRLMRQYLERRDSKRPLCLAVFGPPGSGKSFGVEQVAKSVGRMTEARVEKLEFNLSQFETTRDLVAALHRVRDEVLRGGVPLVFFDEFDCQFGTPLGWLRYFLAPMQDGAFKDGEAMHPIGKAIFVFAGGLSRTFAHFSREAFEEGRDEPARAAERQGFKDAKGPDFVSRMRGYVNILGPNPDPSKPGDRLYLIRRATILRSLLTRNWGSLLDPEEPERLNVDETVLRALIGVPAYKHGIRSMEAVLEMSLLEGRSAFEPAALPPLEQLEQHVDAEAFARLVLQGVLFTAARDAIAEAIHERYRRDHGKEKPPQDPSLQAWAELAEGLKRSNRAQADDIIRKLERIGCGYRPAKDGKPTPFRFSQQEVELLAEEEHGRWMKERSEAGYSYGPVRDAERKTHPQLVPWSALADEIKEYDRKTVRGVPEFLGQAGFEVYRL